MAPFVVLYGPAVKAYEPPLDSSWVIQNSPKRTVNGILAKIDTMLYFLLCPVDLIKIMEGVVSADAGWAISWSAAAAAKLLLLWLTLCDPRDGSPPGSPVPGILQARTLEWVAISFSNAWKRKVKVKSLSHVRLFVTPWTAAHQAPPSMGFSRQEYWSGVPSPSPSLEVRDHGIRLACRAEVKGTDLKFLCFFLPFLPRGTSMKPPWS